jgi:hypothetical protein
VTVEGAVLKSGDAEQATNDNAPTKITQTSFVAHLRESRRSTSQ